MVNITSSRDPVPNHIEVKYTKGKWVKYNGRYYYASKSGVLAENGWKRIKTDGRFYYFYFKNLTAVTNKPV